VRQVDFTVSNGLVYPLTVSTFAIGIKMGKNFYLQQKENELLKQQKLIKEVQLLKAQIHPRFLFRSLNAVYEDTLKQFNKSPALLLKLSDLLSYILYESNDEKVLLQKELDMVENYLALEKLNLGNDIQIIIDRNVNAKESGIAPLILLPILEIVFEQDIIAQSRQLVLNISMNGNDLLFILELNTLQEIKEISFQDDESMVQVQKRLQALYPARHSFTFKIQEKFNIIFSLSLRVADETGEEKVANHLKALA
jgi:LytS/YehU family sensor histidine kinase